MLLPGWTVYSGHIAEVLDARAVQKGIFAFYLDGAVTRYAVLKQIGLTEHAEVDVFVHGSFNPLGNFCQIQPRQGGLIQVLPRGQVVHWMSELDTRLADPGRWDPTTEAPQPQPGRFIALQSEEEQYIHQATRDQLPPLDVAATVFGHPAHTIWLRAPTERPTYLELAGRRIHSIVAVLEYEAHPMGQTTVLFLDLRGIGKWPQWLAISGRVFDPDAYVDGLQLPFIEEHSVVIYGGIPRGGGNTLLVEDGEVITMTLRRTANLTPTEQECPLPTRKRRRKTLMMAMTVICCGPLRALHLLPQLSHEGRRHRERSRIEADRHIELLLEADIMMNHPALVWCFNFSIMSTLRDLTSPRITYGCPTSSKTSTIFFTHGRGTGSTSMFGNYQ